MTFKDNNINFVQSKKLWNKLKLRSNSWKYNGNFAKQLSEIIKVF